jgi:hypothetical protein
MDTLLGLRRPLFWLCLGVGLGYGLLARFIFGLDVDKAVFEVMSFSFIFVVPVVVGFVTTFLWPSREQAAWWRWIVWPWGSSLLTIVAAMALAWEGLICAIVWVPLFLLLSSVGGVIGGIVKRVVGSSTMQSIILTCFVLFPFALSPVEQQYTPQPRLSVAETAIRIQAPADVIWQNIRAVPLITPAEHTFSVAHAIGFPKPLEATLIGEGVGAVRHATFEGDVLFVETITEWEPLQRLAFTIAPDPAIPPTTFDTHVVVGGDYFDVLTGSYRIERVGPEEHILHLTSRHRLSTRFNAYTNVWTRFFMNDIQQHILKVIKQRCEQQEV